MFLLSEQFNDKFNKVTLTQKKIETDNDDYNELVKVYQDYEKKQENKVEYFFKLKVVEFNKKI